MPRSHRPDRHWLGQLILVGGVLAFLVGGALIAVGWITPGEGAAEVAVPALAVIALVLVGAGAGLSRRPG